MDFSVHKRPGTKKIDQNVKTVDALGWQYVKGMKCGQPIF